jgi:hypothetical protein
MRAKPYATMISLIIELSNVRSVFQFHCLCASLPVTYIFQNDKKLLQRKYLGTALFSALKDTVKSR